jgi:hypothetical protein
MVDGCPEAVGRSGVAVPPEGYPLGSGVAGVMVVGKVDICCPAIGLAYPLLLGIQLL